MQNEDICLYELLYKYSCIHLIFTVCWHMSAFLMRTCFSHGERQWEGYNRIWARLVLFPIPSSPRQNITSGTRALLEPQEEPCSSADPELGPRWIFKDDVLGWPVGAVCISPACFWSRQGHISAVLFTEIAPRCNHCVTAHLWNLAELQDVWGLCA